MIVLQHSVQARRKPRAGRAANTSFGDKDDSAAGSDDDVSPEMTPSPTAVECARGAAGSGAAGAAAATAAATAAAPVGAAAYAADVSVLLQNAKDYKQAGLLELNNLLHSAVSQVKGSMHMEKRKLLEYAPMHAPHAFTQ